MSYNPETSPGNSRPEYETVVPDTADEQGASGVNYPNYPFGD
jgi:hypothetical protein